MAASNREVVGKGLDLVKIGLMPFVEREYRRVYNVHWAEEIADVLGHNRQTIADPDSAALLKMIQYRWNEVFDEKLGKAARSYVNEMIDVRNRWAHQESFTLEDAHRALDTMTRLLQMASAEEAQETERLARDLLRRRFEEQAKREVKRAAQAPTETDTTGGLSAWRDVVTPHPDVASGRYQKAEFAADLAQVHRGEGEAEYRDPVEFFRRTYLTEGLRHLLKTALLRLSGQGGDPVVELQTSFGGGKTHSMLAIYHLLSGSAHPTDLPGLDEILDEVGIKDLPKAKRAVFVGTAYDPAKPHPKPEGITVHTMWGEIAYQLGKAEGRAAESYALVAEGDRRGVAPGSDTLKELFDRYGPALILIDEWVAFARNIYGETDLPAGTFDQNMTFAQALTEAAKRSKGTLVVASVPASNIEIGGSGGQEALARLQNTFGRLESVWKPASQDESYEIVRRRLFQPPSAQAYVQRDAVINEFIRTYREHSGEFPSEVRESGYRERMKTAYPVHPELFDRLYQDWSTLERFQRTRGVLRLMAEVVHELWERGDKSLLIMPGTLPIDSSEVRDELTQYLPDAWNYVIDSDVDGGNSKPLQLDQERGVLGRYSASRRVTRTVFLGSAPAATTVGARGKGIEEVRLKLGCVQPGEPPAIFIDALNRLTDRLSYLYAEAGRYWFDTRPSLNRIAADRTVDIPEDTVHEELVRRLRALKKPDLFTAVHVAPASSADIADESGAKLVILHPKTTYRKSGSAAESAMREMLTQRGNSPRQHRNTLIFLAPDSSNLPALDEITRQYLAWKSISSDREPLNLTPQDVRQAEGRMSSAEDTLLSRLQETYNTVLIPQQPDPVKSDLELSPVRVGSGQATLLERVAQRVRNQGAIITEWAPMLLAIELDKYDLWGSQDWLKLEGLWTLLSTYTYLPRLKDENVLLSTVRNGVRDGHFGYAERLDADGNLQGVRIGSDAGSTYLTGLLVKAEAARAWLEAHRPQPTGHGGEDPRPPEGRAAGGATAVGPTPPPKPTLPTRFYAKKETDQANLLRDTGDIANEVLRHVAKLPGARARIVLEIDVEVEGGIPEDVARTVRENARVLKLSADLE